MFVEDKKFEPFAKEFKETFISLIKGLKPIWKEYDFKTGKGDPYFSIDCYTKEEIKELNDNLEKSVKELIEKLSSEFKLDEYKSFIKEFLLYFSKKYIDMRWFYNEIDYDDEGKITPPVDLYSIVGDPHQGKLNIVIGSTELDSKDDIKAYLLQKYAQVLDKQAEVIINNYKDDLELLWDEVLYINLNKPTFVDIELITRKFNK